MTRYADPERCPDCLAPMSYGASRCEHCGLSLEGPLASQLFATLSTADDLLIRMRTSAPAVAAAASTQGAERAGGVATLPPPVAETSGALPLEPAPPHDHRVRVSGASVPKILLGLGALCLLVAALVFLAVAWSAMGVAGRTGTLLGFTAIAGGLSAWAARRELRAAAESLGVVALGLLSFDLFGARDAGWLGDIGTPAFFVVLGAVVGSVAALAATAVRRTPAGALVGAEVFVVLGTASVVIGTLAAEWFSFSAGLTLLVVATAVGTAVAHAARSGVVAVGLLSISVLTWLVLLVSSWDRALANPTLSELWGSGEVWPLLAAAALVGAPALARRLPLLLRISALAVAVLVVSGVLLVPFTDETTTVLTSAGAVVVGIGAALAALLPRPWRRSVGAPLVLGVGWLLAVAVVLAAESLQRLVGAGEETWAAGAGDAFAARPALAGQPAAWLLPVLMAAVGAGLVGLARSFRTADRLVAPLVNPDVVLAVAALTAVLTLGLYPVPMLLVNGVLLLVSAAYAVVAVRTTRALPLVAGAAFLGLGLLLALHAEWLTLLSLTVALVLSGLVHLRWPRLEVSVAAGALVAGSLGALVWTAGEVLDTLGAWVAIAPLLALAALVLGGPALAGVRVSGPPTYALLGSEGGALVTALVVAIAGLDRAAVGTEPTWAAVYLTLTGATASALALLRPDRRPVGWLGGFLLVLASWVRLADVGVEAPEAYTLPAAVALLVVAVVHLRRTPGSSTLAAMSPGLALALVPSLVWVLADPVALRSVLLGAACLGLVVAGLRLGWSALLVHGAVVGALLVLRLATPVAEAVPRWALIGTAGVLLVALGITWETRVREARALAGYVRSLR